MKSSKKKPQLRVCSYCKKAGHNKSTCPEFLSSQRREKPAPAAMKFFIHHVSYDSSPSAHVVDLKTNKSDPWKKIYSEAPTDSPTPLYHFYHERPVMVAEKTEPARLYQNQKPFAAADKTDFKIEPAKPKKEKMSRPRRDYFAGARRILQNTGNAATGAIARVAKPNFNRVVVGAAVLILLVAAPLQARSYVQSLKYTTAAVAGNSTEGFMALQESTASLLAADSQQAEQTLNRAVEKFDQAVSAMENNHRWLQKILTFIPYVSDEVQSRQKLVTAGASIASGNAFLLRGLNAGREQSQATLTDRIEIINRYLKAAVPDYQKALRDLTAVKPDVLPLEYQASFKDFRVLFTALVNDLNSLSQLGDTLKEIFGGTGLRRYLVVFQNEHEIRPTGGFIGSFALLDVKDGKIVKMTIPAGGSYDLQGQLTEYLEPPTPLLLANKRWEFQDANWFADFPASAEKLLWFYRKSRNLTADGVIAVNSSVLTRLLTITGPLNDSARGLTLTADNAVSAIQKIVEEGPEKKANKPKQILSDLAPQFISYLENISPSDVLPLLTNLQEALEQKEIQAYFTDAVAQNSVEQYGWSGKILPAGNSQDYLMVVNTNIQGMKSDANITQTISHQALIQPDGSVIDTVTVTRSHAGVGAEKLYAQPNIDYLRVYVPAGAKLLGASGFSWPDESKFRAPESYAKSDETLLAAEKEIGYDPISGTRITEEFGKTAFGNWLIVEPGAVGQAQFVYLLPFKTNLKTDAVEQWKKLFSASAPTADYQLIAQRQSGVDSTLESQVIFPDGWKPVWNEGNNMTLAANGAQIAGHDFTSDEIFSLITEQTN